MLAMSIVIYDESNSLLLSTEKRYQFYYDDSDEVETFILMVYQNVLTIAVSIGVFLRAESNTLRLNSKRHYQARLSDHQYQHQ